MNINPVDRTSFTSVVPVKVFIDGKLAGNEENIKRGVKALTKVLKGPSGNEAELRKIIGKYAKHDRDYDYWGGYFGFRAPTGSLFRNFIDNFQAYFMTGKQAMVLEELGKKIGPAKHNGLVRYGRTDTYEAASSSTQYFDKAREFISKPFLRIRERINPQTKIYEGEPLTLNIFLKSNGKEGKSSFKTSLFDISFTK